MRERANQAEATRRRIVEATVHLHSTIGLAAATVTKIAAEAGVTRLTVYRHFPDVAQLFAACNAHWSAQQVRPDVAAWLRLADPGDRICVGLAGLYRFYRGGEAMLTNVHRDWEVIPDQVRHGVQDGDARLREVLLQPFAARGERQRRLRAVIGHAASFTTWRSLCVEQGLSDREAVGAMTALVLASASSTTRHRRTQ